MGNIGSLIAFINADVSELSKTEAKVKKFASVEKQELATTPPAAAGSNDAPWYI